MSGSGEAARGSAWFEHPIEVRPSDRDAAGHLNHVALLSYFEHARVKAHAEVRARRPDLPDMNTVVRRLCVDYLGQADVFDRLLVRSRVARDGHSSRTWEQVLVHAEGGREVARAEVVSVLLDRSTGRPTRLPEVYRDAFRAWPADRR